MANKEVAKHVYVFNKNDNGGESLVLTTTMYDNGDAKNNIYFNQELTLQSYCNSASFTLCGAALDPAALRELANQLDSELAKVKR